jgi:signal transduction histidine kinase
MSDDVRKWSRPYAARLRAYLSCEQETGLVQAYKLGRKIMARSMGVLEMARMHHGALAACLLTPGSKREKQRLLKAAETFFMEALSPFEATHRGFGEANRRLHQLNRELEQRNADLAKSKDHYRELFQQARVMEGNLRHLSSQVLHTQEEERCRISRELHDQIGQALTLINLNLGMLQKHAEVNGELLQEKIVDTRELLTATREAVHRFARELRPAMLDELGLLPALRCYLKAFGERTGLRVRFRGAAEAEKLNGDQRTALFRVAQEALINVAKHARASQANVTLRFLRKGVQMQIKDNGHGFDLNPNHFAHAKKRLGLLGMHERVRLVNGQCAVSSQPGKGTTVLVEIPLNIRTRFKSYEKNNGTAGGRSYFDAARAARPAPGGVGH